MKHLALVICLALSALAQKPAQTPVPNQATRAEVDQLLVEMNSRQQMVSMIEGMRAQMKRQQQAAFDQMLQRKNVTVTPEQREKAAVQLDGLADDVFKQMPYDEMLDAAAEAYRKHFTSSDVHGLMAFFQSPIGKKFLRESPSLIQESMQASTAIMQKRMPALIETMENRMQQMVDDLAGSKPAPKQ